MGLVTVTWKTWPRMTTVAGPAGTPFSLGDEMTTATEPCTTSTSDALQRVHHHSYVRDRPRRLAGEPVQALCGIVKRANPKASELPCCPMCADLLARGGDRCGAER